MDTSGEELLCSFTTSHGAKYLINLTLYKSEDAETFSPDPVPRGITVSSLNAHKPWKLPSKCLLKYAILVIFCFCYYFLNRGIVPITCDELFKTMAANKDPNKVLCCNL